MYKIANVILEIKGLDEKDYSSRLELFRTEEIIPDVIFEVNYVECLDKVNDDLCVYSDLQFAVILRNNRKFYYYRINKKTYAIVEEIENNHYEIKLDSNFFRETIHPYFFPSLLLLERLLLPKNAFVLHSSYISVNNNGVLFTAPSGGGKSTQAELWKRVRNAKIINGDKSIVGKETGKWYAYGIPFSGSSDYCENEKHPLRAIIILKKAPENRLVRVGLEGFSQIFSQVTVNPWDPDFCNELMDLVIDACSQIPVFIYFCTKEENSVNVLFAELLNEELLHGIK